MSSLLDTFKLTDPNLEIADKVHYGVYNGGRNVSAQSFAATSQASNNHTYALQIPSLDSVTSREILWESDVTFNLTGTVDASGTYLLNWGDDIILGPYPLNSAITSATAQVNTQNFNVNLGNFFDPICRFLDNNDVNDYNSLTPTQLDHVADYSVAGYMSSPFSGYYDTFDWKQPPRGAFPIVSMTGNTVTTGPTQQRNVSVTVHLCEPLFLSPFIFGRARESGGLNSVSQINLNMNLDSLGKRMLRWKDRAGASTLSISSITYANSKINCKFLSAPDTMILPRTPVIPYTQFVDYVTPPTAASVVAGASGSVTSNSQQLSSIPNMVIAFIRPAALDNTMSDSYATIDNVNITFFNQTGLLGTFTNPQLFHASKQSGSSQTYYDFKGSANNVSASPNNETIGTCGSVLGLRFGQHIQIPQDMYSVGSIVTTSFQITVNYTNNTGITMVNPQLTLVFLYEGLFESSNGVSQMINNGVLSKQMVLDTITSQNPISTEEYELIGGKGLWSSIKSFAKKVIPSVKKMLPVAKDVLKHVDHDVARKAVGLLDNAGYGVTGGRKKSRKGSRKGSRRSLKSRLR